MPQTQKPHIMMLVLLISFGTISGILLTPGLPEMAEYFHLSPQQAQQIVSLYVIGYALGQLPYGPLSNRYGRKPALIIGVGVQLLGCLLCLFSAQTLSFNLLLLGRFLMALGASVGLMMAFTLLNDFYPAQRIRPLTARLMLSFAILPSVAVILGGILCDLLYWQACMVFLIAYAAFLLVLIYLFVQEPPKLKRLDLAESCLALLRSTKNPNLIGYSLLMGGSGTIIYTFNAISPFLGIEMLGMSETAFGIGSALPPLGMMIGSFIVNRLHQHVDSQTIIKIGLSCAVTIVLLMVAGFYYAFSVWMLFIPMTILYTALTLILSNASVLAIESHPDKASASSMMNFTNLAIAAIGISAIQSFEVTTLLFPLALIGCCLWMLCTFAFLTRYQSSARAGHFSEASP